MTDFVRIADPVTGSVYTVPADVAADAGVKPLDEPAVDRFGSPLPAAYGTAAPATPDHSWSAQDLRDWADAHGVDISTATKKDDVLAAIQKATKSTTEAQEAAK